MIYGYIRVSTDKQKINVLRFHVSVTNRILTLIRGSKKQYQDQRNQKKENSENYWHA